MAFKLKLVLNTLKIKLFVILEYGNILFWAGYEIIITGLLLIRRWTTLNRYLNFFILYEVRYSFVCINSVKWVTFMFLKTKKKVYYKSSEYIFLVYKWYTLFKYMFASNLPINISGNLYLYYKFKSIQQF